MQIILEVGNPFQWKPGKYKSRIMWRVWWGWFAFSWLRISVKDFAETEFEWKLAHNPEPRQRMRVRSGLRGDGPTEKFPTR